MKSDENDNMVQGGRLERLKEHDVHVLKFLDSIDAYMDAGGSLCCILQQGWINIASARQSMGISRVNSVLFSLKSHTAATSVKVIKHEEDKGHTEFELLKWSASGELVWVNNNSNNTDSGIKSKLRQRDNCTPIPAAEEEKTEKNEGEVSVEAVKQQREAELSMFGRLVSPKLRAAQLSFETALEMVMEMANKRSSINEGFDRISKSLT